MAAGETPEQRLEKRTAVRTMQKEELKQKIEESKVFEVKLVSMSICNTP